MTEADQNNKSCSSCKQTAWLPPFIAFILPFFLAGGYGFFIHAMRGPAIPSEAELTAYSSECWANLFILGLPAGFLGLLIYKFVDRKSK